MSNADPTTGSATQPNPDCTYANSGAIYLVLDAPAAKTGEPTPSASGLPKNFRTMTDNWHKQPGPNPPSRVGLDTLNASGSAQFCKGQLQAIQALLTKNGITFPMTIIDLRQESHGFFELAQPLQEESTIAVGWFAERDWMSIGKNLVSINADEEGRFHSVMQNPNLPVIEIKSVTAEGGVCTGTSWPVEVVKWTTENGIALDVACQYQRFPATDHVRPQDIEVDQFLAFEVGLQNKSVWLHFHCRGGDGRTTTFLAMHDVIHNAPTVTVDDILNRQYLLGGVDLDTPPDTAPGNTSFKYPFAVERAQFMQNFYKYVCDAKPDNFAVSWSNWLVQNNIHF